MKRGTTWRRFWTYVHIAPGCWECTTVMASNEHARYFLTIDERRELGYALSRKSISAHLVAWHLIHDEHAKFVDRTCGNTKCVRPRHLILRTPENRFWSKVQRGGSHECWPWLGGRSSFGYGQVWDGKKAISAHVFSYRLHYGEIPNGKFVLHKRECNHAWCVNPNHLYLGTQQENVADMVATGRQARGIRTNKTVLTAEQVIAVLRAHEEGITINDLALIASVARDTIRTVVNGTRYKDVIEQVAGRDGRIPGTPRRVRSSKRLARLQQKGVAAAQKGRDQE